MKKKSLLITAVLVSPLLCMADATQAAKTTTCPTCPKGPSDLETWISFLPVIFYVLIIALTVIKLRKDGTKLSDLMSEKDPTVTPVGVATVGGGAAGTPTTSQSVSRFIAFITGLVALAIGICITTFYMYCYFKESKSVDLSNLTTVIWGLGIGVLPYGFNKASTALKTNP